MDLSVSDPVSTKGAERPLHQWALWVVVVIAMLSILGVGAAVSVFLFSQDLSVLPTPQGVVIDVTWGGEYQANVHRIRITDAESGHVVWELAAADGQSFPLWKVGLHQGDNATIPADVTGMGGEEDVVIIAPATSSFSLDTGVVYRLDLWTVKSFGVHRQVTRSFSLRRQVRVDAE